MLQLNYWRGPIECMAPLAKYCPQHRRPCSRLICPACLELRMPQFYFVMHHQERIIVNAVVTVTVTDIT